MISIVNFFKRVRNWLRVYVFINIKPMFYVNLITLLISIGGIAYVYYKIHSPKIPRYRNEYQIALDGEIVSIEVDSGKLLILVLKNTNDGSKQYTLWKIEDEIVTKETTLVTIKDKDSKDVRIRLLD